MATGTVTIEIDQATAALLQAQAAKQGVSLETRHLAGNGTAVTEEASAPTNLEQFMTDMESLAEGTEHIPATPLSYNRADIYFDHD